MAFSTISMIVSSVNNYNNYDVLFIVLFLLPSNSTSIIRAPSLVLSAWFGPRIFTGQEINIILVNFKEIGINLSELMKIENYSGLD